MDVESRLLDSGREKVTNVKPRKTEVLKNNKDIVADPVFKKIISAIDDGWDGLNESQKEDLLTQFKNLINALHDYHSGYINLKSASNQARSFIFDDIKRFQESVENADKREKILHDLFLDAINILSRKMKALGLDNKWRGDSTIHDVSYRPMRDKVRNWMFKIFNEEEWARKKQSE